MMTRPALAIALIALAASAAFADTGTPRSITINYADLDLKTMKGKRSLDRRIARAMENLCGARAFADNMFDIERIDKCRAVARTSVEPQLAQALRQGGTRLSSATVRDERQ
jgi:UrcA family protein